MFRTVVVRLYAAMGNRVSNCAPLAGHVPLTETAAAEQGISAGIDPGSPVWLACRASGTSTAHKMAKTARKRLLTVVSPHGF